MSELRLAIERRRAANRAVEELLKVLYPPGTELQWEVGGYRQRGIVLRNCHGDRLEVSNDFTGRNRFIYARDIVC